MSPTMPKQRYDSLRLLGSTTLFVLMLVSTARAQPYNGTNLGTLTYSGSATYANIGITQSVEQGGLVVASIWACPNAAVPVENVTAASCQDSLGSNFVSAVFTSNSTLNCRLDVLVNYVTSQGGISAPTWNVNCSFPATNDTTMTVDKFSGLQSIGTMAHNFMFIPSQGNVAVSAQMQGLVVGVAAGAPVATSYSVPFGLGWSNFVTPARNTNSKTALGRSYATANATGFTTLTAGGCPTQTAGCLALMIAFASGAPTSPQATTTTTAAVTTPAVSSPTSASQSTSPLATTPAPPPSPTSGFPTPQPTTRAISPPTTQANTPSATSIPVSCANTPLPAPTAVCLGNVWFVNGNLTAGNITMQVPMVVNGSLSMLPNASINIPFSGTPMLNVTGSAAFNGASLTISVSSNVSSPGRYIAAYAANVTSLFGAVAVNTSSSNICPSAQSDFSAYDHSVGLLLSDCSSHKSSVLLIAIIIVSVAVVLVIVLIVVGIILQRRGVFRRVWRQVEGDDRAELLTSVSYDRMS